MSDENGKGRYAWDAGEADEPPRPHIASARIIDLAPRDALDANAVRNIRKFFAHLETDICAGDIELSGETQQCYFHARAILAKAKS